MVQVLLCHTAYNPEFPFCQAICQIVLVGTVVTTSAFFGYSVSPSAFSPNLITFGIRTVYMKQTSLDCLLYLTVKEIGMIIQNFKELSQSTEKKKDTLEILESGLQAANPENIICQNYVTPNED